MAYDVKDKMHVYETVSASGTIYLFLDDQQVLAQSFRQHIKIHVVYDKLNEPVFTPGEETLYKDVDSNGSTMIEYVALPLTLSPCPVGQDQIKIIEHHSQAVDIDKKLSESEFSNDELPMIIKEHTANNPTCSNTSKPALLDLDLISSEAVKSLCRKEEDKNDNSPLIDTGDPKKGNGCSKGLSQRPTRSDKKCSSSEDSNTLYFKHVQTKKKSKETNVCLNISIARLENGLDNVPESIKSCAGELKQDNFDSENKDECDKPEKKTKLKKIEQEKEVICEYCKKTFKSQHDFFEHRKGEKGSYQCNYCSKVVAFKAHLLVHMRKHGTDDRTNNTADQALEVVMESNTNTSENGIKCHICGISVSTSRLLKAHTMIHTGEFAYKCCVCGFRSQYLNKYHLDTHLKAGPVQCKICNMCFLSRSELSKHQLSHEFKCNICDKLFPNRTSREYHYKKDHKEDILRCHICSKMYSSNDELMSHLKYHRHRSKTQCTICGLMVLYIQKHMQSHDQVIPGGGTYVCDQCPKQFNQKLSFKRHMKAHSQEKPYVCIECPKRFAWCGGLNRHMLTHTQERPFVCEICGKACSRKENLRIHMKVHRKVTSVLCEDCGESFSYKNALKEHIKSAHCVDVININPPKEVLFSSNSLDTGYN